MADDGMDAIPSLGVCTVCRAPGAKAAAKSRDEDPDSCRAAKEVGPAIADIWLSQETQVTTADAVVDAATRDRGTLCAGARRGQDGARPGATVAPRPNGSERRDRTLPNARSSVPSASADTNAGR